MLKRVARFKGSAAERKLELFEMTEVQPEEFSPAIERHPLREQTCGAVSRAAVRRRCRPDGEAADFCDFRTCTALIRRAWGGNHLLGEGEKVRDDHRHHAIDALTIALTTPEMVRWAAGLSPEERRRMLESKEFADNELFRQAKSRLDQIAVSHHVVNKLRGALHQETFYSRDFRPGTGERHIRIALDALPVKELGNIVDAAVKRAVLSKLGVTDPGAATEAMLKQFKDPANLPVMRDRAGNVVNTIRKVRVRRSQQTRTIGRGDGRREVANGENYVLAIFARLDDRGNEVAWEGEIVSLLDAVFAAPARAASVRARTPRDEIQIFAAERRHRLLETRRPGTALRHPRVFAAAVFLRAVTMRECRKRLRLQKRGIRRR